MSSCVEELNEKTLICRSQHNFLITFFLDALNGSANQTKTSLSSTTRCLSPVFLLEQPKNYQDGKSLSQKLQRGPTTWKDMPENAWNDIVNWRTKKIEQIHKVSSPCLDDHRIKKEELKHKGELPEVCSHIVLQCLYLVLYFPGSNGIRSTRMAALVSRCICLCCRFAIAPD